MVGYKQEKRKIS